MGTQIDTKPVRVAITDDDDGIRSGLSWIIDRSEGFECVGEYSTCRDTLRDLDESRPDVLLMDIGLPDTSGIDCTRMAKERHPDLNVLMLTVYSENTKIFDSLRAGAVGYILKKTPPAKLLEAIRDAHGGGAPMSGEIARMVLGYFHTEKNEKIDENLTAREDEILKALTEGHSYKAIAGKFFLSVHTVRFHLHNIYEKLHVRSRGEAVAKAMKSKLSTSGR